MISDSEAEDLSSFANWEAILEERLATDASLIWTFLRTPAQENLATSIKNAQARRKSQGSIFGGVPVFRGGEEFLFHGHGDSAVHAALATGVHDILVANSKLIGEMTLMSIDTFNVIVGEIKALTGIDLSELTLANLDHLLHELYEIDQSAVLLLALRAKLAARETPTAEELRLLEYPKLTRSIV